MGPQKRKLGQKIKWCDPGNKNCTWGKDNDLDNRKKHLPYKPAKEEKLNWKIQQIQSFQNQPNKNPNSKKRKTSVELTKQSKSEKKNDASDRSDFYQKFNLPTEQSKPSIKNSKTSKKTKNQPVEIKKSKSNPLIETSPNPPKKQKLTQSKSKTKTSKTNLKQEDELSLEYDHIEFGEVVLRPPSLSIKPKTKSFPLKKSKSQPIIKDDYTALQLYHQQVKQSYKQAKLKKISNFHNNNPKKEKFNIENFYM